MREGRRKEVREGGEGRREAEGERERSTSSISHSKRTKIIMCS